MDKSTKHHSVSLIFAAVLLLVTAVTAAADTHYKEVIYFDETWTIPLEESPCDFPLDIHNWGSFRINYWLDENGQVTKELDSFGSARLTASANGKSIKILVQGPFQIRFDGYKFTARYLGPYWLFIAPGYGNVLGSVGQEEYECTIDPVTGEESCVLVKFVGSHLWEDFSQFCEYMSG